MSGRGWWVGWIVCVACWGWCSVAAANESSAAAEAAFIRGSEAFEAGDTATALREMRAAFETRPDYRTAGGLGQVELHLGSYRDAAEHLDYSLRHYPDDGDPESKGYVLQGFAEARSRVVTVSLERQPRGAVFLVDDRVVANLPVGHDLFIEPGLRRIAFRKPGYRSQEQVMELRPGERRAVHVDLVPETSGPANEQSASSGSNTGTVVLLTGGVASLVALGTGVGFHLGARAAAKDADDLRESLRANGQSCVSGRPAPGCSNLDGALKRSGDRESIASASFFGAAAVSVVTLGIYAILGLDTDAGASGAGHDVALVPSFDFSGADGNAELQLRARF